ncbi:MAG: lipase secretion chaperone [Bradymonadia bacterium]
MKLPVFKTPALKVLQSVAMACALPLVVVTPCSAEPATPASLKGTTLDCQSVRFTGTRPVADIALRRCLDHCLTLEGELSLPEIRSLFVQTIRDRHQHVALRGQRAPSSKALGALFDRYLGYHQAEEAFLAGLEQPVSPKVLRAALNDLEALQRQWLGSAAEAFFGEDNRTRRVALGAPGHPMTSTAPAQAMLAIEIDEALQRWAVERVPLSEQRARLVKWVGPKAADRLIEQIVERR